jgi:hypothetical protein
MEMVGKLADGILVSVMAHLVNLMAEDLPRKAPLGDNNQIGSYHEEGAV